MTNRQDTQTIIREKHEAVGRDELLTRLLKTPPQPRPKRDRDKSVTPKRKTPKKKAPAK